DSERFLATTQIGITVAGASAAAMGGVVAIDHLKPIFDATPVALVQTLAEPISVGIVVLIISYFSLVLGELVPKILALKNPERLALSAARPLEWFARVAAWGIRPLALSSRGVLRVLGKAAQGEKVFMSAEEINFLMQEGREKGVFDKTEQELIHSVFEFTDMSVKEVMIPRPKMCAIEIDTPTPDLLKYIDENKFSRYPVYRKGLNDLVGILYQKDLLSQVAAGKPLNMKDLLHPVHYVPESMKIGVLMNVMRGRRAAARFATTGTTSSPWWTSGIGACPRSRSSGSPTGQRPARNRSRLSRNEACSRRVISPGRPSPMLCPSTCVTGSTSTVVLV